MVDDTHTNRPANNGGMVFQFVSLAASKLPLKSLRLAAVAAEKVRLDCNTKMTEWSIYTGIYVNRRRRRRTRKPCA